MRNKKPAPQPARSKPSQGKPLQGKPTRGTVAAVDVGAAVDAAGLLIVVELGATWPLVSTQAAVRRVLAQLEGETPSQLADRVGQSLDGLFARGVPLSTVILACNERTDELAEGARRRLAGLTLGSMAKSKAGRVVLAASAQSSGRLRHALAGLAQSLFDEWRTAGLEVSLDFGDSAPTAATPFLFTARVA